MQEHKTSKLVCYRWALQLVRRPPRWNSTARHARHARLDSLDMSNVSSRVKSCRVETWRAKWNLGLSPVKNTDQLRHTDPH